MYVARLSTHVVHVMYFHVLVNINIFATVIALVFGLCNSLILFRH